MSDTRNIARALALVACGLNLQACAPMITHGPDVRQGLSAGMSIVVPDGPTYENGDDPGPLYFGALAGHVAYGWRPADERTPALSLGVQVPTLGWTATDVYVQAPRAWLGKAAGGVGVRADGSGRIMPYVQAGMVNADGAGADLVVGGYTDRWGGIGYTVDERIGVSWLSTQLPIGRWVTSQVHLGFARGHVRKTSAGLPDPYIDEDRWVRLGGLTLEVHRPRR